MRVPDRSIDECLDNAEALLDDAKTLADKGRFGTAQSLGILSMEESAKAIVLELANLGVMPPDVVRRCMRDHKPKQVMLVGLEESKFFLGKRLVGEVKDLIIKDLKELERIQKELKTDLKQLKQNKESGFYVDISSKSGEIASSPSRVYEDASRQTVGRAESHLQLARILSQKIFRGYFRPEEERGVRTIWNLRILGLSQALPYYAGNKAALSLTILFDEF